AGSDCASASCVALKCAAAGCLTCWKAQYRNTNQASDVNASSQSFNIVSVGTTAVPLSQLKLRYWFNADARTPVTPPDCFYPPVYCSDTTTRQIVAVTPPRTGATHYVEITFKAAAGTLAAGGQLSSAILTQFHYTDWTSVVRTNDYSFDATKTALTDWNRVTLYHCPTPGGACGLVWGIEPP
ncbi:MAG: cellulose binding domain-containing protein, partial [Polyangia bacterium]